MIDKYPVVKFTEADRDALLHKPLVDSEGIKLLTLPDADWRQDPDLARALSKFFQQPQKQSDGK